MDSTSPYPIERHLINAAVPRKLTWDFDDVTGDDLVGPDLLDAILVSPDDLAHLGLVFLQGLDGGLGIPFLKKSD